jgi:putative hydrolase of the HAD superfamily
MGDMAVGLVTATRAVFLDALGTLVDLEPPWVHLAPAVGLEPGDERLIRAVRAEMAYYKEHSHEGRDEESLVDLRQRCADVLSAELGQPVSAAELVDSVRFNTFPDVAEALASLRSRELTLLVVSNWDRSLGEVLRRCGLDAAVDGVVTSAEVGSRKPDPAIFDSALQMADCTADEALHVGDTAEEDVDGARAAGIRVLLLDREGDGDIASLTEIEEHL